MSISIVERNKRFSPVNIEVFQWKKKTNTPQQQSKMGVVIVC